MKAITFDTVVRSYTVQTLLFLGIDFKKKTLPSRIIPYKNKEGKRTVIYLILACISIWTAIGWDYSTFESTDFNHTWVWAASTIPSCKSPKALSRLLWKSMWTTNLRSLCKFAAEFKSGPVGWVTQGCLQVLKPLRCRPAVCFVWLSCWRWVHTNLYTPLYLTWWAWCCFCIALPLEWTSWSWTSFALLPSTIILFQIIICENK